MMGLQPRNEYESGVYCQNKARSKTRRHGRCKRLSEVKSEIDTYVAARNPCVNMAKGMMQQYLRRNSHPLHSETSLQSQSSTPPIFQPTDVTFTPTDASRRYGRGVMFLAVKFTHF